MIIETYTSTRTYKSFLGEEIARDAQELKDLTQRVKDFIAAHSIELMYEEKPHEVEELKERGITVGILEDILLGRIKDPTPDHSFPTTYNFKDDFYNSVGRNLYRNLIRKEQSVRASNNFGSCFFSENSRCGDEILERKGVNLKKFFTDLEITKSEVKFDFERYSALKGVLSKLQRSWYDSTDLLKGMQLAGLTMQKGYLEEIDREELPAYVEMCAMQRLKPLYRVIYEKLYFEMDKLLSPVFVGMLKKGYAHNAMFL